MDSHSLVPKYKCDLCDYATKTYPALYDHKKNKHKKQTNIITEAII
jgi:hypothetical protein